MIDVTALCERAKQSSYSLSSLSNDIKNSMLICIADGIKLNEKAILDANKLDILSLKGRDSAFLDRLTLNNARIDAMCDGLIQITHLNDPIGEVIDVWTNASGLEISKVRAPLGVIAVIYEARPNVTVDVAGLCIKTGNSVVLRGGSDAINSNRALYECMSNSLSKGGFNAEVVQFVDDTDRNTTMELLKQGNYIDVIIPRGGDTLKKLVLANATMPVIASAGGNCHIYVDEFADIDQAVDVVLNAKTQRPTVCNACEQLLINRKILEKAVPEILGKLRKNGVEILADQEIINCFSAAKLATETDYYTEHLALIISVKTVENVQEAVAHINKHNTSHSEAIISKNQENINIFTSNVDAGCIYVNASTRFTDGFEFGFGAEIGISTQKLHA